MTTFFVGVDLGQVLDPTAVAVVEKSNGLCVRYLERMALRTSYREVVKRVLHIARSGELAGRCRVAADATGVGRPVVEMLRTGRLGRKLLPVLATSGDTESRDGVYYRVPKRDLILGLLGVLQRGELQIAAGLQEGPALLQELGQMTVRMGEGRRERFAAWRHGEHDDLAFAVALACWAATRK